MDSDIAELIAFAREHDVPILMVSDTYFTEEQLRHLLDRRRSRHWPRRGSSARWSTEWARGTGCGRVLEQLDVRPEQLWHVGSNRRGRPNRPGQAWHPLRPLRARWTGAWRVS